MFLLKKLISGLFDPLPLCAAVTVPGLLLLWFTRKQKMGKIIVSLGTLVLLLLGSPVFSNLLLSPLEHRYPPLVLGGENVLRNIEPPIRFIVVLGGEILSDPRIPRPSQSGEGTLARTVEAVRLYRRLPGSKLILCGGKVFDPVPGADVMAKLAEELGVGQQDILLESHSRDTADQAQWVKPMVGDRPFILVTSASHMPRSIALFKKLGMNPVAAPTDYLADEHRAIHPDDITPSWRGLREANRALHEYVGLGWAKLRNEI